MPQVQVQTTIAIARTQPPAPTTPLKSTIGVRKEQHIYSTPDVDLYSHCMDS